MGFSHARRNENGELIGGFMRIWSIDHKEKYSEANISTSKKKPDGTYEVDFQFGFVRLIGHAHELAKTLKLPTMEEAKNMAPGTNKGIAIRVTNCDVTNTYSSKDKKTYTNHVIFDFELPDSNTETKNTANNTKASTKDKGFMNIPDGIDEELPFN